MEHLQELENIKFIGLKFSGRSVDQQIKNQIFSIIGSDYEDIVGIQKNTGYVYSISVEDDKLVFINSSVELLKKFIQIFNDNINLMGEYNEKKRSVQIKTLSAIFKQLDEKSLKRNTWWNYILEQVKDGVI